MYHAVAIEPNPRGHLRYLETAGFVFEGDGRTIVVDPNFTRPSLLKHLFKLRSNEELVHRLFPCADEILKGHSHSDHILDAHTVCKLTGSRFIGSESSRIIALSAGVPDSQIVVVGDDWIETGSAKLEGKPSLHGLAKLGP